MFLCANCDNLRDADDGCEERPGNALICVDCAAEDDAAAEIAEFDQGLD
jgi:hypothetical protein